MKHLILFISSSLLFLITLLDLAAQNEIELRPDGIVVPRTTTGAVTSPVEGMLIYDTSINDYQYYNGFVWSIIGSGPFERSGTLVRQKTGTDTDDFVFGRDSLPSDDYITDHFFFFDQSRGAFRGGGLEGSNAWATDSLGAYSFAYGYNTKASGNDGATAMGIETIASGSEGATAMGIETIASGSEGATAMGRNTTASGKSATAMGRYTIATGDNCTVVGRYNDTIVSEGQNVISTSPLFIIGNGDSGSGNQSNAMVVRKDGFIGIGTSTPSARLNIKHNSLPASPQLLLSEIGNDGARINFDNDETSNYWTLFGYPKSDNPDDAVFNIYYEKIEGGGSSGNKFQVFANGNAITEGKMGVGRTPAMNQLEVEGDASKTSAGSWLANSDRRIKTDIRSIDNGIELIKKLHPVRFKYTEEWKARHPSIKDQYYYNYIAQEFRKVFPDAVQGSGEYLENDAAEILQIDTYNAQIANIAATQELIQENDLLKNRIAKLENMVGALQSMVGQTTTSKITRVPIND